MKEKTASALPVQVLQHQQTPVGLQRSSLRCRLKGTGWHSMRGREGHMGRPSPSVSREAPPLPGPTCDEVVHDGVSPRLHPQRLSRCPQECHVVSARHRSATGTGGCLSAGGEGGHGRPREGLSLCPARGHWAVPSWVLRNFCPGLETAVTLREQALGWRDPCSALGRECHPRLPLEGRGWLGTFSKAP